jgi:hypothetical protein
MRIYFKDKKNNAVTVLKDEAKPEQQPEDMPKEHHNPTTTKPVGYHHGRTRQCSTPQNCSYLDGNSNRLGIFSQRHPKTPRASSSVNSAVEEPVSSRDNEIKKTSAKLANELLKHHNPELCVCSECICGRHLCKFHPAGLNLTKMSTYDRDYPHKKSNTPTHLLIAS